MKLSFMPPLCTTAPRKQATDRSSKYNQLLTVLSSDNWCWQTWTRCTQQHSSFTSLAISSFTSLATCLNNWQNTDYAQVVGKCKGQLMDTCFWQLARDCWWELVRASSCSWCLSRICLLPSCRVDDAGRWMDGTSVFLQCCSSLREVPMQSSGVRIN